MQRNFEKKSQIVQIKNYQDIEQPNCHSEIDMLNFDTFLSTPDNIANNESQGHQIEQISRDEQAYQKEEMMIDKTQKLEKRKKLKPTITPETRLSNYVFPNIIRQVKQCLSNSFQAQNRFLYSLLTQIFRQLKINYQIWAFDAILVILIYLRDKTNYLTHKKYSAVIDHISSTLSKYLAKFVSKPFTKQQIKYLTNQYNHCIKHLKVYDDVEHTFDTLIQQKGQIIKQEFFECVLLTRRRQRFKFVECINRIEKDLCQGLVQRLIDKICKEKKEFQKDKEVKEGLKVNKE